jgi:putative spermidine/putrescine transport system substrate-binding protein
MRVMPGLIATVLTAGLLTGAPGVGLGEEKVVHVMSWGGDYEKQITQILGPLFLKETGYRIQVFSKPSSAEMVATVRAQRNNPQVDVVVGDEGPQVGAPDLWASFDARELTNMTDMYPLAQIPNSSRVRAFAAACGLLYDAKTMRERGVAPPAAWADLWRPELKGKVAIAQPGNVYGYSVLVAAARLAGGSQQQLDPGFAKMRELAPNLATVVRAASQLGDLFSTGGAWIGVYSDSTAFRMHKKGMPVVFVHPREGAFFVPLSIAVVKGSPHPDGARRFVNFMLGAPAQQIWAENFGYGPLNRKAVLTGDAAEWLTYGPARVEKLAALDWELMVRTLPTVVDRWNTELGK